jgi:hypothetical protein
MEPGAMDAGAARQTSQTNMLRDIGAGIGYAFRHPLLRTTMAVTVFGNFALSGALGVALVVLVNQLTHSAVSLGLVTAAVGVGGILGGLGAGLLGRLRRRGVVAMILWTLLVPTMALVPVAAGSAAQLPFTLDLSALHGTAPFDALTTYLATLDVNGRVGLIAALLGFVGFILAIGDTMFLTIMQQRIAPEYMARVFSVQFVAGGITQPLSLVAGGYVAATYGAGVAFLGAGAIFLLGVMVGFASRELRRV